MSRSKLETGACPGRNGETLIHSVGRDVDEHVAAEHRPAQSETRYRLLAENGADMVFQLDDALRFRYASPASRVLLGRAADELVGIGFSSIVDKTDHARIALALGCLIDGHAPQISVVCRLKRCDERPTWAEINFSATANALGRPNGVVGAARDVSARKAAADELARANVRLRTLAERDGLTGLFNRRALDDALSLDGAVGPAWTACLVIDVDHFKAYNDRYGRLAGDDCLRRIAAVLNPSLLRNDFACRYGGEEFVVLLEIDLPIPESVAERVRSAVAEMGIRNPSAADGIVTVSVGVSAVPEGAVALPGLDLLAAADEALYAAKRNGRNRIASGRPSITRLAS